MLDRLILSAVLGASGWHGIIHVNLHAAILTAGQIREKAKLASVSAMCNKKPKSKTARDLCKRWEKHNG
jgi:hypothetical protein